ncbi:MAG: hypothetical protein ACKPKO_51680, partial [Candidatus Fonsibacter sp.]
MPLCGSCEARLPVAGDARRVEQVAPADEAGVPNGDWGEEIVDRHDRSRREGAKSLFHQLRHLPKNPY